MCGMMWDICGMMWDMCGMMWDMCGKCGSGNLMQVSLSTYKRSDISKKHKKWKCDASLFIYLQRRKMGQEDSQYRPRSHKESSGTGHCGLNRHLNKLRLSRTPRCSCGLEEETGIYLICNCPKFLQLRRRMLGGYEVVS